MSASDEPACGSDRRHRAEPAALELRPYVGVDLLAAAVGEQQAGVAHREERVGRRADVRRLEPGERRLADRVRQLHAAVLLVERAGHQPRVGEDLQGLRDLGDHLDLAVDEPRLVLVGLPVVRREVLGGDLLGEIEDGVERLPGVLGEPRPLGQRLDVQPLVEQEVEVAAGQDQRRGAHRARLSPRGRRRGPLPAAAERGPRSLPGGAQARWWPTPVRRRRRPATPTWARPHPPTVPRRPPRCRHRWRCPCR